MRVFMTGATGFLGAAIVADLIKAGYHVLGLARSDAAAAKLREMEAEVHLGSLEDIESLRCGAQCAVSDGRPMGDQALDPYAQRRSGTSPFYLMLHYAPMSVPWAEAKNVTKPEWELRRVWGTRFLSVFRFLTVGEKNDRRWPCALTTALCFIA